MLSCRWGPLADGWTHQKGGDVQHIRIATYSITKGTFGEVADKARTGMLPIFQKAPGFIRYGVADLGDNTITWISVWESRPHADAAVATAASWVKKNLGVRIKLRSNKVGDLPFFSS